MSLLNKQAVRQLSMDTLERLRPALKGKLTQFTTANYDYLEGVLRREVQRQAMKTNSAGSTFRFE